MTQHHQPDGPRPDEQPAGDAGQWPGGYPQDAYQSGPYQPPGQTSPGTYPQGQYPPNQYPPAQYPQGQYPASTPYGQPSAGQGWVPPGAPAAKRPVWKTVIGWILVVWAGLAVLGTLANLVSGRFGAGIGSTAEGIGYYIGVLLTIGGPLLIAWLLLRRK